MRGWWDIGSLNIAHVLTAINQSYVLTALSGSRLVLHVCGHLCDCHDSIFSCPAPMSMSRVSEQADRSVDLYVCHLSQSCWPGSTFQEQGSHEGTYHGVSLANKNLVKQVQELFRGSLIVPNSYRPVAVSEGQISISYFHTPPPHPFHFPSLSL